MVGHSEGSPDPGGHPVVVVGYDGSAPAGAALERAIDRTRDSGRVVIVHAWEPPPLLLGSELYPIVAAALRSGAEGLLEQLPVDHPRLGEVRWEARLVDGAASKGIAEVAAAEGADEVLMGTRGAGRLHAVLGGTAQDLLHRAECPVTFIPLRMVEARVTRR